MAVNILKVALQCSTWCPVPVTRQTMQSKLVYISMFRWTYRCRSLHTFAFFYTFSRWCEWLQTPQMVIDIAPRGRPGAHKYMDRIFMQGWCYELEGGTYLPVIHRDYCCSMPSVISPVVRRWWMQKRETHFAEQEVRKPSCAGDQKGDQLK